MEAFMLASRVRVGGVFWCKQQHRTAALVAPLLGEWFKRE
jgi:hypothetical protein